MITHPIPSMYADIRRLWQQAFGDTDAWLDTYFRFRHADANMYVTVVEDEEVASMLSLLPLQLTDGEHRFSARYLYAVATEEQWQGLGLSQTMTEYALEQLRTQGVQAVVTVPATASLFTFYAGQGFVPFSSMQMRTVNSASLSAPAEGQVVACDAAALFSLRRQLLEKRACLWGQWDMDALSYALLNARQTGGGAYRIETTQGLACAVVECAHEQAYVKELLTEGLAPETALGMLDTHLHARQYHLRLPASMPGSSTPFSKVRWLDTQAEKASARALAPPYFSLVLD